MGRISEQAREGHRINEMSRIVRNNRNGQQMAIMAREKGRWPLTLGVHILHAGRASQSNRATEGVGECLKYFIWGLCPSKSRSVGCSIEVVE
jgi:hypothetical protein